MAYVLLLGIIFVVGCAPKTAQNPNQQQVAGKEETYGTPKPTTTATAKTTVTVKITATGITIMPASIPTGNFTVKITNDTNTAKTFKWSGIGMKTITKTLKPGESITVAVTNTKPGAYTITVPATTKGAKAMMTTLKVTKKPTTTTMPGEKQKSTGTPKPAGK
jgi:uncharacterized cupredoxin-like copper-binding protein